MYPYIFIIRKNSSKAYDLVYKGIPPNLRRTVWSLLIGNDLNITKEQYLNYYKQREDYHKIEAINSTSDSKEKSNPVNLITLDLPRTFPMLAFFQPGGPYHHSLKSILECYVFYNPDIGYVQGMSYLAAILLLYMDEYEAFTAIANLLNRKCHNAFYKLDDGFQVYCRAFNLLLKDYLPNLYHYFLDIGLSEEMYLLDWILTIYGKSLPLDTSTRIWDIYLLEGDILLFKSAIGILKTLEKNILEFAPNLESCKKLLSRIPEEDINEESLIENIRSIDLNTVKFRAILKAAS